LALRQLSTTEQRLRAVMAVQAGGRVGEVAFAFGVSRRPDGGHGGARRTGGARRGHDARIEIIKSEGPASGNVL
jgi:hypothetical protein